MQSSDVKMTSMPLIIKVAALIFVAFIATGGWRLVWNNVKNWGWMPQDQKMFVEAKSWTAGEFKNCTTLNVELEEPTLQCDGGEVGKQVWNSAAYDSFLSADGKWIFIATLTDDRLRLEKARIISEAN